MITEKTRVQNDEMRKLLIAKIFESTVNIKFKCQTISFVMTK